MGDHLPPLPPPDHSLDCGMQPFFREDQLLAFAREAVKQEREACLRICESTKHLGYVPAEDGGARDYYDAAAEDCAAAIRARSEQGGG